MKMTRFIARAIIFLVKSFCRHPKLLLNFWIALPKLLWDLYLISLKSHTHVITLNNPEISTRLISTDSVRGVAFTRAYSQSGLFTSPVVSYLFSKSVACIQAHQTRKWYEKRFRANERDTVNNQAFVSMWLTLCSLWGNFISPLLGMV